MICLLLEYREDAKKWLRQWGKEMNAGRSRNVLDLESCMGGVRERGGMPPGGGSFSVKASRVDKMLHELLLVDPETARYLMAYALDMTMRKLAEDHDMKYHQVRVGMDEALAAFTMMVYCRFPDKKAA